MSIIKVAWLSVQRKLQWLIFVFMIYWETHTEIHLYIIFKTLYFLLTELQINNIWYKNIAEILILLIISLTTLWSMPYLHVTRNTTLCLFSTNTMTFIKIKWLGRLEKGHKQMFLQSCWNKKTKEIALFLENLFILSKFGKIFLYHFRVEILNLL